MDLYYPARKIYGDLEKGIATQCLVVPMAKKLDFRYYLNVALNINPKLGGTNSIANLGPAAPNETMILDADVTHPAPGSSPPSIAGIVGTFDGTFANYVSEFDVQLLRQETIEGTQKMIKRLLQQWFAADKKYPSRMSDLNYFAVNLDTDPEWLL